MQVRTLGHYRIVEVIGEGGMGVVYKAWDTRLDRPVAIKTLTEKRSTDERGRKRFLREARAASALNHPGIVTIHEIGTADDMDYIVMEYLEGQTLTRAIGPTGLPASKAVHFAIQIAEAMAAAHAAGIVHRDLKPANVMITAAGGAKVLDFGLAKSHRAGPSEGSTESLSLTADGAVMGTLGYMSPEQAQGEEADHRSDIFSFGALLYEMLAGRRPFVGKSVLGVLEKIVREDPPPLRQVRSDVPSELEGVLRRTLAKRPNDRFQSMNDVASALRPIGYLLEARQEAPTSEGSTPAANAMGIGWKLLSAMQGQAARRTALALALAVGGLALMVSIPNRSETPIAAKTSVMTASDHYQEGIEHLRRKDRGDRLKLAIASLERAVRMDPRHAASFAALAEAYVVHFASNSDGQVLKLAGEAATRAVDLDAHLAIAHLAVVMVRVAEKRFAEAAQALDRASELDPESPKVYFWRGRLTESQGHVAKAIPIYEMAVTKDPGNWEAWSRLGAIRYGQHRYAEAIQHWESALAVMPDNPWMLRSIGAAHHQEGRYGEAAAAFQRALAIEPAATVYSNLGTSLFFQGKYRDAAEAFSKAIALNPNRDLYWGNRADARRWVPDLRDEAGLDYRRAIQLSRDQIAAGGGPPSSEQLGRLAVWLAKSGDSNQAVTIIKGMDDPSAEVRFRATVVYELAGRREEALRSLEAALNGGHPRFEVQHDPELLSLRADPRYHILVSNLKPAPASNPSRADNRNE